MFYSRYAKIKVLSLRIVTICTSVWLMCELQRSFGKVNRTLLSVGCRFLKYNATILKSNCRVFVKIREVAADV